MVVITKDGIESFHPFNKQPHRFCVFEYIYFARPDSMVDGRNVYELRKRAGEELAKESPALADIVVAVPDSSIPAGAGLCQRVRPAVRARHHPQPLCWAHLHRAERRHPPFRRAPQAQPQPRDARGQARRADRRLHRAAARRPRRSCRWCAMPVRQRCISGSPARRRRIPASTASTRRTPTISSPMAWTWKRCARFIGADSLAFITMDGLYRAMGRAGPQCAGAEILRRLLLRLLPDLAARPRRRQARRTAVAAGGCGLTAAEKQQLSFPAERCDSIARGREPRWTEQDRSVRLGSLPSHRLTAMLAGNDSDSDLMTKALENKIALVTGASRGIGRAAAKALAKAGAHVILVARTVGGLEEVDDEIRKEGGAATLVAARPSGLSRARPAGRHDLRTLGTARRVPGQCGIARRHHAARASGAQGVPGTRRRQRDRELAVDPFARSAAAPFGFRARAVRHFRRGAEAHAVLGRLRDG